MGESPCDVSAFPVTNGWNRVQYKYHISVCKTQDGMPRKGNTYSLLTLVFQKLLFESTPLMLFEIKGPPKEKWGSLLWLCNCRAGEFCTTAVEFNAWPCLPEKTILQNWSRSVNMQESNWRNMIALLQVSQEVYDLSDLQSFCPFLFFFCVILFLFSFSLYTLSIVKSRWSLHMVNTRIWHVVCKSLPEGLWSVHWAGAGWLVNRWGLFGY